MTVGKVYAALMIFDFYKQNKTTRDQMHQAPGGLAQVPVSRSPKSNPEILAPSVVWRQRGPGPFLEKVQWEEEDERFLWLPHRPPKSGAPPSLCSC